MKKLRKIGGAFMLLIMLVMMMHNSFPHFHHHHESHSHDLNNGTHHSHQEEGQHHNNQNPSKHNPFDFISFLLTNHAHAHQLVDNNLVVEKCVKEQNQSKKTNFFITKQDGQKIPLDIILTKKTGIPFLPDFNNFYYYTSSPLRGPPTLG